MQSEYRLRIAESFSPGTLPMERLAKYVMAFAKLLGERDNVHFHGVEPGSAVLVARIDPPARPKVRERIAAVRDGHGPKDAQEAFTDLDDMLRKDNTTGTLDDASGTTIIPFPGRDRPEPLVFGPFREDGTLDGELIRVGGKDDTVPIHLRDGPIIHTKLNCTPTLARKIAPHLYGPTLRVHGTGTWFRGADGAWELKAFKVVDFEILDDAPLNEVVNRLRAVKGSTWSEVPDPVRALLEERHGEGDAH
ncbi:MAG: hypothetical protein IID49_03165 [Proteobacteria bacterium]|nr:hypothetical protein [Pseudomonadota bacterium]